ACSSQRVRPAASSNCSCSSLNSSRPSASRSRQSVLARFARLIAPTPPRRRYAVISAPDACMDRHAGAAAEWFAHESEHGQQPTCNPGAPGAAPPAAEAPDLTGPPRARAREVPAVKTINSPETSSRELEELVREHLPLVGHLVRELLYRIPSHVNRDD